MRRKCWRFDPRMSRKEAMDLGLCWVCDGSGPTCMDRIELDAKEVEERFSLFDGMVS